MFSMQVVVQNINYKKLHAELLTNRIKVLSLSNDAYDRDIAQKATIIFAEDTDMVLVQSIIDAHDPTPIPPQLSETEKIRLEMARSNAEMFEMMVSMMGGGM